ncbi:MAG TPA: hypothetical protein PLV41_05325 [Miltoncostaeales bacterium]|jgi:hypothetical protein|nr:hypothetical protein [Miltoncostaeales bacterium]
MKRALVGVALAMASAGTATAGPTPTTLEMTLQPGQRLVMTMGQVPRGEFGFTLRATGTGAKNFVLSQQRVGSVRFKVIDQASSACQPITGGLRCSSITTPAPALRGAYIFRVRNLGTAPLAVTLRVTWRSVTSAG